MAKYNKIQKQIIGNCTLYCGDIREVLPSLGECADLLFSDVPYKVASGGNNTSEMGGCFAKENYNNDGNIVDCDIEWHEFMPLLYNCLRGDAHAYVMSSYRHIGTMYSEADNAGFRLHNLLPWNKGTATPSKHYMRNTEYTGLFFKGKEKIINDCGSMANVYIPQENYGGHPTTKPVALAEYYIRNSSQPGQTIVDPFMGVCSAGVAAINLGLTFIGIDIKQEWFDKSCTRLEEALRTPKAISLL